MTLATVGAECLIKLQEKASITSFQEAHTYKQLQQNESLPPPKDTKEKVSINSFQQTHSCTLLQQNDSHQTLKDTQKGNGNTNLWEA